jgi:hypothetical protein
MSEAVKEREKFPVGTLTRPGGTMTSEGFIPHCLKDGVFMPVALVFPKDRSADFVKSYADPHKHPVSAELMYVQPDGRHVTV